LQPCIKQAADLATCNALTSVEHNSKAAASSVLYLCTQVQ